MQKENFSSGQKILKQDLTRVEDTTAEAVTERIEDNFISGITSDLLNGMAFIVGPNPTSLTIRTGVGYDSNGERIIIDNESINFNSSNPTTTTPDGIGGNTLTPQSTGSANIFLTTGVVNLLYIKYLEVTNPHTFSLHKVTHQKLFTEISDGYVISVVNAGAVDPTTINTVTSAPVGGPWVFLGLVDYRAGGTIASSMFDLSQRPTFKVNPNRVNAITPKADLSNVTPTGNYGPSKTVNFDQHVKAVGSTAPTAKNPHGMTLQDIGFNGKTVEVHEQYLHTSGIVNGDATANVGNSLNLKINPRCPDRDEILIYGFTATQFVEINGVTLSTSDLFGASGTKLFSFVGLSTGTYYFWVNTSTRTVESGTTAPIPSELTKFLLWTVAFSSSKGATNITADHFLVPPSGPCAGTSNFTNLVDNRLFGNTGSINLNVDAATDTFTIDHNVTITGTLNAASLGIGGGIKNSLKANVAVKSNGTNPNTQVDVSADVLSVQGVILNSVSSTVDITVSGAGGLDTGSEASSTWYAVHVISNSTGITVSTLLSTSATSVTLPAGYTKFRRVGWVYNNASSNFVKFERLTDWIYFTDGVTIFTQTGLVTGTTSFTNQGVPPTSRLAVFAASTGNGSIAGAITGTTMPSFRIMLSNDVIAVTGNFPLSTSQQIDLTTSGTTTLTTLGYYDVI